MGRNKLKPKLITVLKEGYSVKKFVPDLIAGVIVGIVALPLAIAFAIASGVKPEQGLYTAVVAGFLISVLSGSRVQIGGPTGAFIVIVYGIVQKYGYDGLAVATLMAGVILVLMGLARLGRVIEYIPYPVTIGFTSGIAVIIFTSQFKDLLGLAGPVLPADFVGKVRMTVEQFPTVNFWAVGISVSTVLLIVFWSRFVRWIPGSIVAIVLTAIIVEVFHLPVETVASRFGEVPHVLPRFSFPVFDPGMVVELIKPATAIAFLAGIESLLSAVVADGMTGFRHRPNMELIAQGAANIGSVFFGGIPATGAIARTATNVKNGGRTPVAGIIHALTLLIIMLVFGKWAGLIPMAALAGILVAVAYNMSEWQVFVKLFRSPKSDVVVLLTTFFLTIFVDLVAAIEIGVMLAALLFMRRMILVTEIGFTDPEDEMTEEDGATGESGPRVPPGVEVFEINGPFFFGAADRFKTILRDVQRKYKVLILRMKHVPVMDATGLRALEDVFTKSRREGTVVILSEVNAQPRRVIRSAGLDQQIGLENIQPAFEAAIQRAERLLEAASPGAGTKH